MVQGIARSQREELYASLLGELGREAREHRFAVAPNPCVGAAVLSGRRVIGKGFHRTFGGPHAEVNAFAAAARSDVPREQWDTLVVTLEPCSSAGKTPPCTDAILASGVSRVVVGDGDPDPRHQGKGFEVLEEAGIEVVRLGGFSPLEEVSPHFLHWNDYERLRRPRPWMIAKWAQTRSGHLTPPEHVGEGRWITGPESLEEVHALRASVDAIVTGIGTVLADDPRLTVRHGATRTDRPAPLRVVLDSYLRTPPEARLFQAPEEGEAAGEVHVLCQAGAATTRYQRLLEAGAGVHGLHADSGDSVDLWDVASWLWERGVRRAMLECGPTLLRRMMNKGFVDQLCVYTGPIGGGRGESMADWLTPGALEERRDRESGDDAVLEAMLDPS